MQSANRSVKIVQVDGKDLYLTNARIDDKKIGYKVINKYGLENERKYRANLDYSLELIQLRETYKRVYGVDNFSFRIGDFDYTKHVCSVTFKYSIKEYNRFSFDTYIRHDKSYFESNFQDCVWIENGELLGIQVGKKVNNPVDESLLGKFFVVENEKYVCTEKFKTLMSGKKIREWIYQNGFYIDGIKFVRYKRSAGSARTGKCLFIDENLYSLMHKWEMCGLDIKEGEECDLAGLESYISLTASSIIGAIEIRPENILLVDDYESVFKDNVVAVFQGEDGHLKAEEKEVEIRNSIWDGESLIDVSLMREYSPYGFILLRNSFFKSAAFNCNLQKWFRDNNITRVDQLNGVTRAKKIEDVLYVITPSSLKYLKYGSFDTWLNNISSVYGVVKHEKKPKYLNGKGVKVSYQLINTLAMTRKDVVRFLQPSLDYLDLLKKDLAVFRWHIHYKAQVEEDVVIKTKDDLIYKLLGVSDDFVKTKLFQEFKYDAIRAYINELRLGHIIVNGNYEVLAGNIMELLCHTTGQFFGKSMLGVGNIHTKRFEYGKKLLGCRSPHTSSGNIWLPKNVEDKQIDKYFNFTTEIVAINSICENTLQRLSGADFDSDVVLLTDNEVLTQCASYYYHTFKVPTMIVDSKKIKRNYTSKDKASLDIYCDSDRIGVIVNLSQEINTIMWDKINRSGDWSGAMSAYYDNCLLSILSGIAIDATKREYPIDCNEEFSLVRARYNDKDSSGRAIRPYFFGHVARKKGYYDSKKKNYLKQMAPMDWVQEVIKFHVDRSRAGYQKKREQCGLGELLLEKRIEDKTRPGYVDLVICMVRDLDTKTRLIYNASVEVIGNNMERKRITGEYYDRCVNAVRTMNLNDSTLIDLIAAIDDPKNSSIRRKLWTVVFTALGNSVFKMFKSIGDSVYTLEECKSGEDGDVKLFGIGFAYRKLM